MRPVEDTEFPNQKNGWVQENDGTWSLYAPEGTLVIASRNGRAQVSEPQTDFDVANKKYGDDNWAGGGGAISVTDGSTTVDPATSIDLTGATVTNEGGGVAGVSIGGSQPVWLMNGAGDPIVANPTTPSQVGALYVDTDPAQPFYGLYVAAGATSADWVSLGGNTANTYGVTETPAGVTAVGPTVAGGGASSLTLNADPGAGVGADSNLFAGTGAAGQAGGGSAIGGGAGDGGNQDAAFVTAGGGTAAAKGKVNIYSNGVSFDLMQAAHVADGSSVDQLRDALIAAGLMAAS